MLKKIVIGVVSLALLALGGAALLIALVDPEEYRAEIEQAVTDATGMTLRIEGGISKSFGFPVAGLVIENVSLGAHSAGHVEFGVDLLPLWRGELHVKRLLLRDLQVALTDDGDASGADAGGGAPAEDAAETDFAAVSLDELRLENAAVTWTDNDGKQTARVELARLDIDNLHPGARARARVEGRVLAAVEAAVDAEAEFELAAQTIGVPSADIALKTGDASLRITGGGAYDAENNRATATLQSDEFAPAALAQALGAQAPNFADPQALGKGSVAVALDWDGKQLKLQMPAARIDDSSASGAATVTMTPEIVLNASLQVDRIDLARYAPGAQQAALTAPGGGAQTQPAAGKPADGGPAASLTLAVGALHWGETALGDAKAVAVIDGENFETKGAANLTFDDYRGAYRFAVAGDLGGRAAQVGVGARIERGAADAIEAQASARINMAPQRIDIRGASVTVKAGKAGLRLGGAGSIDSSGAQPAATATVHTNRFAPLVAARAFGLDLPAFADSKALAKARLDGEVVWRDGQLEVRNLKSRIDDSDVSGAVAVRFSTPPKINASLHIDLLDLAPYTEIKDAAAPDGGKQKTGDEAKPSQDQPVVSATLAVARLRWEETEIKNTRATVGLAPDGKTAATLAFEQLRLADAGLDLAGTSATIGVAPDGQATASGAGDLAFDDYRGPYRFDITSAASGETAQVSVGARLANSKAGGKADLGVKTRLAIKPERIDFADAEATIKAGKAAARFAGSGNFSRGAKTQATATLQSDAFNPRALAAALGQPLPGFEDTKALARARLGAELAWDGKQLRLGKLNATLDDSKITGAAAVRVEPSAAVSAALHINRIDLARYTLADDDDAPAPGGGRAASGKKQDATPATLTLTADAPRWGDITLGKSRAALTLAADGSIDMPALHITMGPGAVYRGTYNYNARGKLHKATGAASRVDLARFETGLDMRGLAQLNYNLVARGDDADSVKRSLAGDVKLRVGKGAVALPGFVRAVEAAAAFLLKRPPRKTPGALPINAAVADLRFKNGVGVNNNLAVNSPELDITGRGRFDVGRNTVNYRLLVGWRGEEELQVPVIVTGALDDPKFRTDLKGLVGKKARERIKDKLEKELGKGLDILKDKLKLPL